MKTSRLTALDFLEDLNSRYARRWFFATFLFLVSACILLIYQIDNLTKSVFISILVEILSGSLIILSVSALYLYFIGPNPRIRNISVIRSQDIGDRMRTLPLEVTSYMFWGRSGSFFRAYPLLELDKQATTGRRHIQISVLLPDPRDCRLVNSYRDILKSLGENPSKDHLLSHVIATCMVCAILSANNKYLNVQIRLSRFLPSFRLDISENGAILTQDHKSRSALYFEHGSEFYEMFRSTVISEYDVSYEVNWNDAVYKGLSLCKESCNNITLQGFNIEVHEPSEIEQEVARLITQRPHRYK